MKVIFVLVAFCSVFVKTDNFFNDSFFDLVTLKPSNQLIQTGSIETSGKFP